MWETFGCYIGESKMCEAVFLEGDCRSQTSTCREGKSSKSRYISERTSIGVLEYICDKGDASNMSVHNVGGESDGLSKVVISDSNPGEYA